MGRERNLFGPDSKAAAAPARATVDITVKDDPNEEAVSRQVFREGLSCLGKTFNNARHAYLKLNISDKSLTTIKVSGLFSALGFTSKVTVIVNRVSVTTSTSSISMCQTTV